MSAPDAGLPLRVLVADDHPMFALGVSATIEAQPDMQVVGHARSGREAIELYRQTRPDLALLDLRMPDIGGVEATQRIRAEFPDARIVILTMYDGDDDISRALEAGAATYLLKDAEPRSIISAIRDVCAGKASLPDSVQRRLRERPPDGGLSERERELLLLVQKGFSSDEIAQHLGLSRNTIKYHFKNLFRRLEVSDRTEAINEALRRGILHLD